VNPVTKEIICSHQGAGKWSGSFSKNDTLYYGGCNGEVVEFSITDKKPTVELKPHVQEEVTLKTSRDQKWLVTLGKGDGHLKIWEISQG